MSPNPKIASINPDYSFGDFSQQIIENLPIFTFIEIESDSELVEEYWRDFPFRHWHDDIVLYTLDDSDVINAWIEDHRLSCPSCNPLCGHIIHYLDEQHRERRNLDLGRFHDWDYFNPASPAYHLPLPTPRQYPYFSARNSRLSDVASIIFPPSDEDWDNLPLD